MKDVFGLKKSPIKPTGRIKSLYMPKGKSTYSNVLSVKNLAPQLWQLVPQNVKKCKTLNEFKTITKMKKLNSKSYYPDHFPFKF